jgi:glycosyltransferase involved in cell wall biosynthesis
VKVWFQRLIRFIRRPRLSSAWFWLRRIFSPSPPWLYHVLAEPPLVLSSSDYESTLDLLARLEGRELWVFLDCFWTVEAADKLESVRQFQRWSEAHPRHRVIHRANSPREKEIFDREKIPAIFCNHNCFLDERIFRILPEEPKRFRAIYNARLTFFKRHHLAAEVNGLALITYLAASNHDDAYAEQTRRDLAGATWLNGPFARQQRGLGEEEVCRHLNQSRTGLILSACEGGNYASVEYLLCGLPVVTTASQGGRDAFFHPDYVITAEENPKAVAAAVDELIARKLDPRMIRERTLALMWTQRRALLREIAGIVRGCGGSFDEETAWPRIFTHKMVRQHSSRDLARLARGGS